MKLSKLSASKHLKFKEKHLVYLILGLLILSYVLFFTIMSVDRHNGFHTLAFDLGIYDHAIWRFSQGMDGFNYIRGIHIFGDHFTPINIFISPLYWFSNSVVALLVLQTLAFALSALPLFMIAYHYLKNRWQALVVSFSLLMFPAMHYVNLEDYHPEAFILLFVLCAFYFLIKKKMGLYLLFVLLTLCCKEEIALTMFLVGIYVFFRHSKRWGAATSLVSVLWFVQYIWFLAPALNGQKYLYAGHLLGQFGTKPVEIFLTAVNPVKLFPILFNEMNAKFMLELFGPVAFLSILGPLLLLPAAALWMNLITSWPYAHNIYYHYIIPVIPFVFLSLSSGLGWIKKKSKSVLYLALIALFIAAIAGNYYFGPYDTTLSNYEHVGRKISGFGDQSQREGEIYALLAMIPDDASVSAHYQFVPHLTHREIIYNFPNPFKSHYWGTWDNEPELEYVDYIFILEDEKYKHNETMNSLSSRYYLLAQTSDGWALLYKKI